MNFRFVDDVIFAHKPRLLDVAAQLKRSAHAAQAWLQTVRSNTSCRPTDARDYFLGALKVTFEVATQRAESVVYDCIVFSSYSISCYYVLGVRINNDNNNYSMGA